LGYEANHVEQRGITMIVTFIILGIIVAAVVAATIVVTRSDSGGPRPFCQNYDSRYPQ
jgi:hypothetical protein